MDIERGNGNGESSHSSSDWPLFGRRVPKAEIQFFAQITLLFIVVIAAIVQLTINPGSQLWTTLLSSCIGYILPNPTLKLKQKHVAG